MTGQKKTEVCLYVALWIVLFILPMVLMCFSWMAGGSVAAIFDEALTWQDIFITWKHMTVYCVAFFLHNFFVAPLLVYRSKRAGYSIFAMLLLVLFLFGYSYVGPYRPHHDEPRREMRSGREMHDFREGDNMHDGKDSRGGRWHGRGHEAIMSPRAHGERKPVPPVLTMRRDENGRPEHRRKPPRAFGGQESAALVIMAMLMATNVGSKYFFKSLDDRRRMREIERQNLQNQLKYLKYQVNPHFFMNTLNNIHALVDIDPEQAKYTIEVLSKLMRYVLYEGNHTMAPLQRELDFVSHYVDLMRIRYTDKVAISVSFPDVVPDVKIPSLLYATFIENAFKHGVSYQKESFIDVCVRIDEALQTIEFCCVNSVKLSAEDSHGGVGLKNAIKRLQLIYGHDYSLDIQPSASQYRLCLRLPMIIDEKLER